MAWAQLANFVELSSSGVEGELSNILMKANVAIKVDDYASAEKFLTNAICQSPGLAEAHVVYGLRATCYLHLLQPEQALDDAMYCTKLCPTWPRGWARLGAAQLCSGHPRAAVSAYQRALELEGGDGSKEVQLGLKLAQEALQGQGARREAAHEQ